MIYTIKTREAPELATAGPFFTSIEDARYWAITHLNLNYHPEIITHKGIPDGVTSLK